MIHENKHSEHSRKFIQFRIRKSYLLMISFILLSIGGISGYYIWCSNHPNINILVNSVSIGNGDIQIETPNIAFSKNGIAEPNASAKLKMNAITTQHEFFCEYVKKSFKTSAINLDISVKDNQMVFTYSGIVTDVNDQTTNYKNEFVFDFVLDADIQYS